jgi:hypothetical protein
MTRRATLRGDDAARPPERTRYRCGNGHSTLRTWSAAATAPELWECPHCGLPAGRDRVHPPGPAAPRPVKTPLQHLQERRSEAECEALLAEALERLRARRRRARSAGPRT